ncbi:MAG: SDR family oxidoreductase [Candidatus Omnitrophica bacterium]|nr:SDR family oxidoreductase [Candidatus Omnitrophota bacterium]
MHLTNRVALVTGGAKRLGRAMALALAERGAHVVISYRASRREAAQTVEQLRRFGVRAEAIRADLANPADAKRLIRHVARRFGRLDVLVNSASVFVRTPLARLTERGWDAHLDANLKGPFLCSLLAARLMRKRSGGKIINLTDWAGERPYRDYLPYCVSKAGLTALTKALAKELAPRIQVVAIAPGPILPPPNMSAAERRRAIKNVPLKRWGSPQDIANAVLFAIEGTDFMTGTTISVDGGRLIA